MAVLEGKALVDYVVDAMSGCTDHLSLIGGPRDWALARNLGHVEDEVGLAGPLRAVTSALVGLQCGTDDLVVVAPCDTPLITSRTISRLLDAARRSGGAVARSDDHMHWTLSAWTARTIQEAMLAGRSAGAIALHEVLEPLQPTPVDVESDEVLNVNTPEDLSRAARVLAH